MSSLGTLLCSDLDGRPLSAPWRGVARSAPNLVRLGWLRHSSRNCGIIRIVVTAFSISSGLPTPLTLVPPPPSAEPESAGSYRSRSLASPKSLDLLWNSSVSPPLWRGRLSVRLVLECCCCSATFDRLWRTFRHLAPRPTCLPIVSWSFSILLHSCELPVTSVRRSVPVVSPMVGCQQEVKMGQWGW